MYEGVLARCDGCMVIWDTEAFPETVYNASFRNVCLLFGN
jgi:hypothetical protein